MPKILVCMGPWTASQTHREGLTFDKRTVSFNVSNDRNVGMWRWAVWVKDGVTHSDFAPTADEARAAIEVFGGQYFEFVKPVKEQLADAQEKIVELTALVVELEKFRPKFKLGDRVTLQGGEVVHRITQLCGYKYGVSGGLPVWDVTHMRPAA